MAISKMYEFTLLAFESKKESLLEQIQKHEIVQFLDIKEIENNYGIDFDSEKEKISEYEIELSKVQFILEKINPFVEKAKGMQALREGKKTLSFEELKNRSEKFDYESIYSDIKNIDEKQKALNIEKNKIFSDRDFLSGYDQLDISIKNLDKFKYVDYYIGSIAKIKKTTFIEEINSKLPNSYIEELGETKDDVNLLLIAPKTDNEKVAESLKQLGFNKSNFNYEGTYNEIHNKDKARLEEIKKEIEKLENGIVVFANKSHDLEMLDDYFETVIERQKVYSKFLKSDTTIVLKGWVSEEDKNRFEGIVTSVVGTKYYLETKEVEKDSENVPIKLKNNRVVRAFEGITSMYSLPKYNEIDPTPLLFPFYMAFFGIMMGDIGYGLILFFGSLAALSFLNLNEGTKNFVKFLMALGVPTIIAGIIFGSAFGVTIFKPLTDAATGKAKAIVDVSFNDDVTKLMLIAIAFGFIDIIWGLLIKAYVFLRDGDLVAAICDALSYILILVGVIVLALGATNVGPSNLFIVGEYIALAGIAIILFSQGRGSKNIAFRLGSGLYSIYGLTSYVGDLVSYTRLMALMLSGYYIAFSFNLMGGLIKDGFPVPGLNYILAGLLIAIGQVFNLALCVLGAYVHTCRLQYVEFFSKFYEGGGKIFTPFKSKNKYIEIEKN